MGDHHKYTIGWITAITTEYVAAKAFLDKEHDRRLRYGLFANDNNIYTLGEMGKHNVVIAQLPKGEYGIAAAAIVARDMARTFPNIRIGVMVGIAGGAPSNRHDIRLGDVVVSAPHNGKGGGLFQYDFGKTIQDQEFRTTGFLDQPPSLLRAAMSDIEAEYEMEGHQLDKMIKNVLEKRPRLYKKYKRPDSSSDRLYESDIVHPLNDERRCEIVCGEDRSKLIMRPGRNDEDDSPAIHYGLIASANQLMKDALIRDRLSAEKDVLCFEMEAAGLMNHFPCVIIRGICDYSDSHKNKEWQGYAAMAAAAYTKDLLSRIPPNKVEVEKKISDVLSSVENSIKEVQNTAKKTNAAIEILDRGRRSDKVIAKLPYAKGSTFDSFDGVLDPRCHPETRVELRRHIKEWTKDGQKSIFWLKGMAGTGKSTISRTVAESFDKERKLGASFFFKRGEADRSSVAMLFTTICAQLLVKIPSLVTYVEMAIEADPNISDKSMAEQFEKLICLPLSQSRHSLSSAQKLIIVIDALDECARDADTLLQILSQTRDNWSRSLQIFITSRPEQQIRYGFADIPEAVRESIELHEIPQPIIKQDIVIFLEYRFAQIQEKYMKQGRSLPFDWPGADAMSVLVEMAVPLFIFAATLCRFIEDEVYSNPIDQLTKVLRYQNMKSGSEMDKLHATYSPILNQMIDGRPGKAQKLLIDRFHIIVGTIVHLAEPLSRSSLAALLNIDSQHIEGQLSSLHSIFSVPSSADSAIRMLHLSFRDFLVDPEKRHKNPFWVNETEIHKMVMAKCLKRMSQPGSLQKNICNLSAPGTLRTEIDGRIITDSLPLDLQYACRFWVYHLKESQMGIRDDEAVHVFLKNHFLHWLESLALLGRIAESIHLIRILQSAISDKDTIICRFLDDAMRFIRKNISVIDLAPLQLYVSALLFTPKGSIIRNVFSGKIPRWIQTLPDVESSWGAMLQTLESHSSWPWAVAFSANGRLLASSGDRAVKLWDPTTGTLQQTLESHSDRVWAVAFSADGKLASGGDMVVKLWDPATGTLQRTLMGHFGPVSTVAFSPDSRLLASGGDKTIKLWDPDTGTLQQTLQGHADEVLTVAFSPDGTLLASGSNDTTVRLWDPATGSLQQTLKGHSDEVLAVAFSPKGSLLASGSFDTRVKLWDPATGALQQTLKGHIRAIRAVAFSPNGRLLASSSNDTTVKLWNPATGTLQQTLKGHSKEVLAVAFSPNGRVLASYSEDTTVKLWDLASSAYEETPYDDTIYEHFRRVTTVAFSPDGRLLASCSEDPTIKLWDPATGTLQHTIEFICRVSEVQFSPDGKFLVTEYGPRPLDFEPLHVRNLSLPVKTLDNHIGVKNEWVTRNDINVIWLPAEYRPTRYAVYESMLAMGHASGRVTVMKLV